MTAHKMDYDQYGERLSYLTELASKGRFISLSQVASRFDCSKRTVKRMIGHLRAKGILITYSRTLKKFTINFQGDK